MDRAVILKRLEMSGIATNIRFPKRCVEDNSTIKEQPAAEEI